MKLLRPPFGLGAADALSAISEARKVQQNLILLDLGFPPVTVLWSWKVSDRIHILLVFLSLSFPVGATSQTESGPSRKEPWLLPENRMTTINFWRLFATSWGRKAIP
jgi:hypothetical protein